MQRCTSSRPARAASQKGRVSGSGRGIGTTSSMIFYIDRHTHPVQGDAPMALGVPSERARAAELFVVAPLVFRNATGTLVNPLAVL